MPFGKERDAISSCGNCTLWGGEWGALPVTRTSVFPQYGDRDRGLSASVYRKEENGLCRVHQLLDILE